MISYLISCSAIYAICILVYHRPMISHKCSMMSQPTSYEKCCDTICDIIFDVALHSMISVSWYIIGLYRPLSQVGSRRKRCPGQFRQDCMGSIPATPSTKHASCFPPSSIPASIETSIKLIVCLS
jgi:hypothetical protein